jgi:hypothetical protein
MKLNHPLLLALVLIAFASCRKENEPSSLSTARPVNAITGTFNANDGDLIYKCSGDPLSPITYDRTWTMMAKNSPFYGKASFALVKGNEFITGSTAYNYWHKDGNNPVTYKASEKVYSNLTPDEDLRLITESKIQGTAGAGSGVVAYLAMLDFNPSHNNFPLQLNGFRLGDVFLINTDQVTNGPGGNKLKFQVIYTLKPVNLIATKAKTTLTEINGSEGGKEFCWEDIVYDPISPAITFDVPEGRDLGDITVYNAFTGKVTGTITIVMTETNKPNSRTEIPVKNLSLPAGKGLKLTLVTDKIGINNDATLTPSQFRDKNIFIYSNYLSIN